MTARHKYGARPTVVDGQRFDSAAEARRWSELRLLERAGTIRGLERQPEFVCAINGVRICAYRADFRYFDGQKNIVEDVKGVRTPLYRLKKRLVEALHPGVTIVEVAAR